MQAIIELIKGVILSIITTSIIFVFVIIPFLFIKFSAQSAITSSPVEEVYHRELVIIIDSILDARFGTGCCEEVIDSDDVSIPIDSLGRVALPDNWK